jgi:hypothetical protein
LRLPPVSSDDRLERYPRRHGNRLRRRTELGIKNGFWRVRKRTAAPASPWWPQVTRIHSHRPPPPQSASWNFFPRRGFVRVTDSDARPVSDDALEPDCCRVR